MQAIVTITCTMYSSRGNPVGIYDMLQVRWALHRMADMLSELSKTYRSSGRHWRETDLFQDGNKAVLVITRDAHNSRDDVLQAETTVDAIMCELRGEVERGGLMTLEYQTKLEEEMD